MRDFFLAITTAMPPSSASSPKPCRSSSLLNCKHSSSATVDVLILILVLFSGAFLIISYFSYIFNSLSLLLSHPSISFNVHHFLPHFIGFFTFFGSVLVFLECRPRSRKCGKKGCRRLKKALEFDLQLQTEECVKVAPLSKVIDELPWKGGSEDNPDYECLRAELRKMAPPSGRAVLIFRKRCGCPVAKLEGWGPKRGRRHKKALTPVNLNGGDDR